MTIPTRIITPMPQELIDRIDDYRFSNRMPSRADTVRTLVEFGLGNQGQALAPITTTSPAPVIVQQSESTLPTDFPPAFDFSEHNSVIMSLIGSKPWIKTEHDAALELMAHGARAIADEDSTVLLEEETVAEIARLLPGIDLVDAVERLLSQAIRDMRLMQAAEKEKAK